jgi:hypothetical protein
MGTAQAVARACAQLVEAPGIRRQSLAPVTADPDQRVSCQKKRHAGPDVGVYRNEVSGRRQSLGRTAQAGRLGHRQKHAAPRRDPYIRCHGKGRRQNRPPDPEDGLRPGVAGQHRLPWPQAPDRAQPPGNRHKAFVIVSGGRPQPRTDRAGERLPCVGRVRSRRARFTGWRHAPQRARRELAKPQGARMKITRIEGMWPRTACAGDARAVRWRFW